MRYGLPFWLMIFILPATILFLGIYAGITKLIMSLCRKTILEDIEIDKSAYNICFLKVWSLAFLSHLVAALILLFISITTLLDGKDNIALQSSPLESFVAAFMCIFVIVAMIILTCKINCIIFKKLISDNSKRLTLSLAVSAVTAPWYFLLPSSVGVTLFGFFGG